MVSETVRVVHAERERILLDMADRRMRELGPANWKTVAAVQRLKSLETRRGRRHLLGGNHTMSGRLRRQAAKLGKEAHLGAIGRS